MKRIFSLHSQRIAIVVLLTAVLFLINNIALAVTPNPGHPWTEVGDGTFAVSGPTTLRTYSLPDASATILTSNTAVTVPQGGTGAGTLTGILKGNGTSAFTAVSAPTGALVGDTDTQTLTNKTLNGLSNTFSNIDLESVVAGILPVSNGGTGVATIGANGVMLGNGTGAITTVSPGTNGNVLTSNGTTWTSTAPSGGGGSTSNFLYTKRQAQVLKNPGAATVTAAGITAPTLTATASNADDANGPWLNHATAGTAGAASGVISAFTQVRRDWEPEYITTIKTDASAITSVRYWVGMFSASPDASGVPNIHAAAFRYDTSVDGTAFWRAVTIAGTGASATVTATTQSIAANTKYLMRIVCATASSDCKFYINDTLVATHTTTLPTATTLMGYGNRVTAIIASARNIKWGRIAIIFN